VTAVTGVRCEHWLGVSAGTAANSPRGPTCPAPGAPNTPPPHSGGLRDNLFRRPDAENTVAARWYDEQDNGLTQPWCSVVFCNPPYGRGIGDWTRRAATEVAAGHAARVVCLVPARTDTAWWRAATSAASLTRYLPGRL